jgi:flagellar protein FliO/FliZ
MKSLTFIRGAGAAGVLALLHASTAIALRSTSLPSTTANGVTTTTAATGENTPLHLPAGSLPSHSSSGGSSSTIVRTIVGLFIVIVVIYGVSWILRQARSGGSRRARGKGLRQVASLALGSGRSLQLVRAGDEFLLLGVAEHGVVPIRRYTEAEAIASGLDLGQADPAPAATAPSMREERAGTRLIEALRRITIR